MLVTATGNWTVGRIGVVDLATGRLRQFGQGAGARYAAGRLFYATVGGQLLRQDFDVGTMTPTGDPEEIASGLDLQLASSPAFDVSASGTMVYRAVPGRPRLALVDRSGRERATLPGSVPWEPQFSPDGRRIAYAANGLALEPGDLWAGDVWRNDIWITDLTSGATQRLTTDGMDNNEPRWSPDGTAITYSSATGPRDKDIFVRKLDGSPPRRLVERPGFQWPSSIAADGSGLLFIDETPGGTQDIWIQPTDGTAARAYVATAAQEAGARISPDGRWVAYTSDETGRQEVYVQGYPNPGRRLLVTASGGTKPMWRRDGRALYYWQGEEMVSATLNALGSESLEISGRTVLFSAPGADTQSAYDVSPDGATFAIVMGIPRAHRLVVALDALGDVRPTKRDGP
jgi:hypothetical protein